MTAINRDEWLSALKDAGLHEDGDPNALTAKEFATMFGLKETTARHRLAALVAAGKATPTKKRSIDGRGHALVFVAYRLLPQRKGKA